MPIYQVGDLIRYRSDGFNFKLDAIGLILEMRAMPHRQADVKVLWSDMSEPRWSPISDLEPVQPDGERGITG